MCDWKNYPLDGREGRLARLLGLPSPDKRADARAHEDHSWLDRELEDLTTQIHADRWTRPLLH